MVIKKGRTQVTFVYEPGDGCKRVGVCGTFNDWQPEEGKMTRQKDGSFRRRIHLEPGQYRYKFLVDGVWREDPQAESQAPNEYGTCDSVVTVG